MRRLSDSSAISPTYRRCAVVAETVARRYGAISYAAAIIAARRLSAAYNRALALVDALLKATTPRTASPLPAPDDPVAVRVRATKGMFSNSAGVDGCRSE